MARLRLRLTAKGTRGLTFAIALAVFCASAAAATAGLLVIVDPTPASNPPDISISSPANNGAYNANGWGAMCSGGGICGTASDRNGVAQVTVAVLRQSTGKYWNGTDYSSSAAVYNVASGTTSWRLPLTLPPDDTYTAYVRAKDTLLNQTPANSPVYVRFTIDTVAPPAPVIDQAPDLLTNLVDAVFHLVSLDSTVHFKCQLDGGATQSCDPTTTYVHLTVADHCLRVYAVDGALNVSATVVFCWSILTGAFTVSGDTALPNYPGLTQPIDLVIQNPFLFDLEVTSVTVTVQDDTTKNGIYNPACVGRQNMRVVQNLQGSVNVPAKSTRSLSQLGVPVSQWPKVEFMNLSTNQDSCKATKFRFSYAGLGKKHLL